MGLRLTVGFSKNPRLRLLVEKAVKTANLEFVNSHPAELFYRNLKFEKFDAMEMALACTLMAKERSHGGRSRTDLAGSLMKSLSGAPHHWSKSAKMLGLSLVL
jgi:hypothetical protein